MNSKFRADGNERTRADAGASRKRRCRAVRSALTIRRRKAASFTLIEMLVVIALIGVLASMLTVVIVFARRLSIQLECRGHLSEIGKTLNQMALNAGGAYPQLVDHHGPWWANVYEEWGGSADLGQPGRLPSQMRIFHCRMAGALQNFGLIDEGTATGGSATTLDDSGKSWTANAYVGCWLRITSGNAAGERRVVTGNSSDQIAFSASFSENPGAGTTYQIIEIATIANSISYGLNFDVMLADGTPYECVGKSDVNYPDLSNPPGGAADKYPDELYYTQVARPAEFILVSEADTQDPNPANWTGSRISMGAIARDAADLPPYDAPIVGRHGGWANVLFADLHVEAMEVGGGHWTKDINTNTALWTLPDD